DADGAGAGDDDRAGELLVEDLLLVGDHVLAHLDAGQHPGHRAGGDDEVVELQLPGLAVVEGDVHALGAGEGAPAVDLGDLVLLHEEVDALDDAVGDLAAALVGRAVGPRGAALDAALLLLGLQGVRELGVPQQRLGRDAPDVEADAAPVLLLDDGHLLAQLARADRRDIPTGAGAQDNNVKVIGHGVSMPSGAGRRPPGTPGGP